MKRKRTIEDDFHRDRWIIPYADFITLLFAFFATMYALSRVDMGKLEMFAGSMKTAFKAESKETKAKKEKLNVIEGITPIEPDVVGMENEFREALKDLAAKGDIDIQSGEKGVTVSLGENVMFTSGETGIRKEALPALEALASVMGKHSNSVVIEGHTDNVPIKNNKYASNWELSTARAMAVLQHIIENYKLSPERFSASGYAEFRPRASNETPDGREKNRRVDIVILKNGD